MTGRTRTLLVSILSFGRPENVLNQLEALPGWLDEFQQQSGIAAHIVIRNNDPCADFEAVSEQIDEIRADFPSVECTLVTGLANCGFGAGHNGNIALMPSDYILVLNDDLGFPHIKWLGDAIEILGRDPLTVCVAAEENPRHLNPIFGNGVLPTAPQLHNLPYAEASILLFDRGAFDRLGGFSADFRWAMCEDSDLSLRVQQNGWRIAHISMPHQHWRSSSFNTLPGQVKSSILEHNRAALFANWRETLGTGRIGRYDVYDLWSEGLGDVFCALPHVLARIEPMSQEQRGNVVVNTSHPELLAWLRLEGVRIVSVKDPYDLRARLDAEGIATLRTTRDVNFSLPFNIHPLLAGSLGIPQAGAAAMASFGAALRRLRLPDQRLFRLNPGSYCVVHLEFERNHEGRALSPAATASLLEACGQRFERIVLIGREQRLSRALFAGSDAEIVDLQGALSLTQLGGVLANAQHFVGIDSFPAHVAQAAGIPASIFFGAVHPLTRVWNETHAWPLTAPLDCIGCYHTHLEPSIPFCMRRDVACTTGIKASAITEVLTAMVEQTQFDWSAQHLRLQALQASLIRIARFHPAPPERLFRAPLAGNEAVSNHIYQVTEQIFGLMRETYHTSTVNALTAQTHELQAELFAARVALDQMHQTVRQQSESGAAARAAPKPLTNRLLQLHTLPLEAIRCEIVPSEQWIRVEAFDDDPQINLPPLVGLGGRVQLRISWIAESNEALQIFWALGEKLFSADQVHNVPPASGVQTTNVLLDVPAGQTAYIRIDPTGSAGRIRLRGSLGGAFEWARPALPGAKVVAEALGVEPDEDPAPREREAALAIERLDGAVKRETEEGGARVRRREKRRA